MHECVFRIYRITNSFSIIKSFREKIKGLLVKQKVKRNMMFVCSFVRLLLVVRLDDDDVLFVCKHTNSFTLEALVRNTY